MVSPKRYSSETYEVYDGDEIVGDSEILFGSQIGGADTFYGDSYGYDYIAYGDSYAMFDSSRGGDDVFYGGSGMTGGGSGSGSGSGFEEPTAEWFFGDYGVIFVGDAGELYGKSLGGNDAFYGGENSSNMFAGDGAYGLYDKARGGNDTLVGGDAYAGSSTNMLLGDAYGFFGDKVQGGMDVIYGGDALGEGVSSQVSNLAVGDAYALLGSSMARADSLYGGDALAIGGSAQSFNLLMGDGYVLLDSAVGAADTLVGGDAVAEYGDAYAINMMVGDAYALVGLARGGNDILVGGNAVIEPESDGYAVAVNLIGGDAMYFEGPVKMGNDRITGGSGSSDGDAYAINVLYGDVLSPDGYGLPGPRDALDVAASPAAISESAAGLFGVDLAEVSSAPVRYGNDDITGGASQAYNVLVGDAESLYEGDTGGNDVLRGGGEYTENVLVGDAAWIYDGARGGNDKLWSGSGDDAMWGDASEGMDGTGGADQFIFRRNNGNDTVYDFRAADGDRIDLSDFKSLFSGFNSLVNSGRLYEEEGSVWIDLSMPDTEFTQGVRIVGVSVEDLAGGAIVF